MQKSQIKKNKSRNEKEKKKVNHSLALGT